MLRSLILLGALVWSTALGAQEAQDRKARSIALLQAEGIPVLQSLPLIETEATSLRRTEEEVIQRVIALAIVAVKAETGDQDLTRTLIDQYRAAGTFSPWEQSFIDTPLPSDQDRINAGWRYESVGVLLWSLGLFDLPEPTEIVNVSEMVSVLRVLGPDGLRAEARLRPQAELLDAADLIYRRHWAARQARLDGLPPRSPHYRSVVYERHYALNWLVGYGGLAWDDITTDT